MHLYKIFAPLFLVLSINASRAGADLESAGLLAPRLSESAYKLQLHGIAQKDAAALVQLRDARHAAWNSFSSLEICLALGVAVALVAILVLVGKMKVNSAKILKLEDRERGLQHSLMLDHQKTVKDAETSNALKSTLAKVPQTPEKDAQEFKALDSLTRAQVDEVIGRQKVTVDLRMQTFASVQMIEFVPIETGDLVDPPAAAFADPQTAKEILGDLALLMTFVKGAVVLIEGHTSGGQAAMSSTGFAIAADRAELVVATLVELGIQRERLESRACPGWLGDNRHDIKFVTLAWGF